MFDHPDFWHYDFADVPANRDLYIIDVKGMAEFEREWVSVFSDREYKPNYLVTFVAVRAHFEEVLELSWYHDLNSRFHEVRVLLPRSAFVRCIGHPRWDGNPAIFVESEWLRDLYLRANSIFALVDAIGVEDAIRHDKLPHRSLLDLRERIDEIGARHPNVALVSFADGLLVKCHWRPGDVETAQRYDYEPEIVIDIVDEIDGAYRKALGLGTYAVLTQGANEYSKDSLLHISPAQNHVSLNSLGLPFAQLLAIDTAARKAIRERRHAAFDLYIDSDCLHSLDLEYGFKREALVKGSYRTKMASGAGEYYAVSRATIQSSRRTRPL